MSLQRSSLDINLMTLGPAMLPLSTWASTLIMTVPELQRTGCLWSSKAGRTWQVNLVEDHDDLQLVLERKVHVGQRLSLHALGSIHNQQAALAGRQGPADLREGPGLGV